MTLTYLNFLLLFVVTPALLLWLWLRPQLSRRWYLATGALCLIAFIWTSPWDNYLVASGVWWYDAPMVLGLVIGYVPIEEYAFFILQTLLTSLLLLAVQRYLPPPRRPFVPRHPAWALLIILPLLVGVLLGLLAAKPQLNYLLLELGWLALLPLTLQYFWGLDILLHHWRPWLLSTAIPTGWLAAMDALAIQQGTWHISPDHTTGILLAGLLPVEELIFFLITNLLIVQGMLLFLSPQSWERAAQLQQRHFPAFSRLA